jgi:hypothetical protein
VQADPLVSPIVEHGDGVAVGDAYDLAGELEGLERQRNGGITGLPRRQHLGLGRKGAPGELTSVTIIAALFAVVVAAVAVDAATVRSDWRRNQEDSCKGQREWKKRPAWHCSPHN